MSSRSFAVFLDNPQPETSKPRAPHNNFTDTPLSPSSSSSNVLATTTEKENLHPITGERPGSTNVGTGNKRKTSGSILATKVHNPPTNKKQKESKLSKPEAKKRKSSTSSTTSTKSTAVSSNKDSKRIVLGSGSSTGSSKKLSSSSRSSKLSSRKVSPMPKVEEEGGVLGKERERIRQSEVDSRCYELTVLPLADVTQAYDTSSMEYILSGKSLVLSRSVKEKSSEPEIRDYYTRPLSSSQSMPSLSNSSSSAPSSKRASSTPPGPSQEAQAFSTPERKQIYAAFTFTSPSPTSVRIGLTRSMSVDAIDFHRSI